ncbi:unnamed protein product [Ambrosiozyma monospora]|uniref:Unnamed protein product n=1 Tax=Ambrosiozyma monospora TaxID=43982 RepID=A0A9W7DJE8_AMBMO|nr:unnamed protein product [Ambrosiozyma monospora]
MTEIAATSHKPKVLYIPVDKPVHDDKSWKTLNEKFEVIYYDSHSIEEWIKEASKPDGKYAGIEAIARPHDLKAPPFGSQFLFSGKAARAIPSTVKVIVSAGHGYDVVDVDYLTKRGIFFCNSPDSCSIATADTGTFLVLQSFRYLTFAEDKLRNGEFFGASELNHLGENPNGKTLGVIGLGN